MKKFNYVKSTICGDWLNNDEVDTACASRLLSMCEDYGNDGKEAKELLQIALRKLEIYT